MTSCSKAKRYLLFSILPEDHIRGVLMASGAFDLIIRKHTDRQEVDFKILDKQPAEEIKHLGVIIEVEETVFQSSCEDILREAELMAGEERFWEVHNFLEYLWKSARELQKSILHEVIGIVVSQIKAQMGQTDVAERVYLRSRRNLISLTNGAFANFLPESFRYPLTFPFATVLPYIEDSMCRRNGASH